MEEIIIDIDDKTGEVKIEANGFVGGSCKELTKDIEAMLGTATDVELKPEYRQTRQLGRTVQR